MVIAEIISLLPKRKDVSINHAVTKQRCAETWKSFKNAQKREVLEISGVTNITVHNTYKEGRITAGVAVAMAKVAGISPFYLTAELEKPGRFSEKVIAAFLGKLGISSPSLSEEPDIAPAAPAEADSDTPSLLHTADTDIGDIDITEEEIIVLLKSLIIRARYNDIDTEILAGIKHALIC
ncbi:MAG: hypothetical protein LBI44_04545 [Oscillospiraceae bacterium]|jgi:hypothetical protein|nr:hypothetical protein [Oscillospiraceae bacterium]